MSQDTTNKEWAESILEFKNTKEFCLLNAKVIGHYMFLQGHADESFRCSKIEVNRLKSYHQDIELAMRIMFGENRKEWRKNIDEGYAKKLLKEQGYNGSCRNVRIKTEQVKLQRLKKILKNYVKEKTTSTSE